MKRLLILLVSLSSSAAHALEIEPLITLKGLFRQVPERLGLLSKDERLLRSSFERLEGGIKQHEPGVALVSSEQELDAYFCVLSSCSAFEGGIASQDRSGLAWNLSLGDDFRLAPKAELVRHQFGMQQQYRRDDGMGFGVGVDSSWRLGGNLSAYASAGRLQLGEGSGYEGLFGIATKVSKARVFVEARWSEMSQQDRLDSGYEYNNVRIGISHEFSGL